MHLAFLGLGQIGGSVARAALASGFASRVTAWTPAGRGPRAAAADGIEPSGSAAEALRDADVVVLAAPSLLCLALLDELAGPLADDVHPNAVITDVASTKAAIVGRARDLGLRFVGGHPMAGRELAGYAAADVALFRERPWLVVPSDPDDKPSIELVEALARACGARPLRVDAQDHDVATALISHAPLVVSAALVEAATARPEWALASVIAASGWAGMTRLATGDPSVGAGILATNAAATAEALRAFAEQISAWAGGLEHGVDAVELETRLESTRSLAQTNRSDR